MCPASASNSSGPVEADRLSTSGVLRVAMVGSRGVPATWGGVERHVEELGAELAERGHDITVYCRTNYAADRRPHHRGMRLRYLPTVGTKHLDAIVHTTLATAAAARRFDVVHFHAVGPGLLTPLARAVSGAAVVQTVHGLDSERAKWGPVARTVLRVGEWTSARVPHATIAVSRHLADHYRRRHGRDAVLVPNGVTPVERRAPGTVLQRLELEPGRYVLFVGRLVPEKAPDLLVRAFMGLPEPRLRLVVAGGSSYSDEYVHRLHRLADGDRRVLFPGYVFGDALAELYSNAAVLASPSSLEAGTPLTVLEAASCGTPVLVSDIPAQLQTVKGGPGERVFPAGDEEALRQTLRQILADPEGEREGAAGLRERVLATCRWNWAAERTEAVYRQALAVRRPASASRF